LIKELIIDSSPNGATIALLQDKQLVELHKEQISNNYTVGDIYLGRVKKIMPGLNAAFIDVGYEKDAFLHYLDLGPQVQSLLKLTKQVRGGSYQSKLLDDLKLEGDINKSAHPGTNSQRAYFNKRP
jgi:ribonuclease G